MLKIVNLCLVIALTAVGTETLVKVKKSGGKRIDEVRKPLLIRINILMVLTVVTAVVTIINVLVKNS